MCIWVVNGIDEKSDRDMSSLLGMKKVITLNFFGRKWAYFLCCLPLLQHHVKKMHPPVSPFHLITRWVRQGMTNMDRNYFPTRWHIYVFTWYQENEKLHNYVSIIMQTTDSTQHLYLMCMYSVTVWHAFILVTCFQWTVCIHIDNILFWIYINCICIFWSVILWLFNTQSMFTMKIIIFCNGRIVAFSDVKPGNLHFFMQNYLISF